MFEGNPNNIDGWVIVGLKLRYIARSTNQPKMLLDNFFPLKKDIH